MPAPTNISKATAEVITSLPFSSVYTTTGQTSALELWWTYTAVVNDRVLGITPFADIAGNYDPTIRVFESDGTTVYKGISAAKQRAVIVPVTEGEQYYFRVIQGGAGTPLDADLTFSAIRGPQVTAPEGSIISTQDEANRRKAPILSATADNLVYQYIDNFAFMEAAVGVTLDNGNMCGDDQQNTIQIWTPALVNIYSAVPSYAVQLPLNIGTDGTTIYLSYAATPGTDPITIRTLTGTGAETTDTWTLPVNSKSVATQALAPNRDGSVVYYAGSVAGSAIHAYDLIGNEPLADLAATLGAGWSLHPNTCVLQDGTILAGYQHPGATINYKLIRYDAAGTILNTYDQGANPIHHLATGLDATHFYLWLHDSTVSNKRSIYKIIKTSDGTTTSSGTYDNFNVGINQMSYDPTYPLNTSPSFGPADTCTFFITRAAVGPIPIPPPTLTYRTDPIRRQRRAPHLADNANGARIFYPGLQLLFEAGGPRETTGPLYFDLRYSDDGGHTWSNIHRIEAGQLGQYRYRAIWRRLGASRDRVFEITDSNEAKIAIVDALLDPDPEGGIS